MEGQKTTIHDCKKVILPKVSNPAGNLTAIQQSKDLPFPIKRIYYLYDIPGGQERGAHGHKNLNQLIVAASGSFEVVLTDGKDTVSYYLNRPYEGLIIKPGLWRELKNFSSGSVCLVLASEKYTEEDYIRDYEEFKTFKDV